MGYEIKYEWMGKARRLTPLNKWVKVFRTIILAVCVFACMLWIIGGDWELTLRALEAMAEDLRQGIDVKNAFSEFCIEVLESA